LPGGHAQNLPDGRSEGGANLDDGAFSSD
jgi:hypothetical protein